MKLAISTGNILLELDARLPPKSGPMSNGTAADREVSGGSNSRAATATSQASIFFPNIHRSLFALPDINEF